MVNSNSGESKTYDNILEPYYMNLENEPGNFFEANTNIITPLALHAEPKI